MKAKYDSEGLVGPKPPRNSLKIKQNVPICFAKHRVLQCSYQRRDVLVTVGEGGLCVQLQRVFTLDLVDRHHNSYGPPRPAGTRDFRGLLSEKIQFPMHPLSCDWAGL